MMVSLQLSAISRQWEEFYHLPGIDWLSASLRGHHQAFDGPFRALQLQPHFQSNRVAS